VYEERAILGGSGFCDFGEFFSAAANISSLPLIDISAIFEAIQIKSTSILRKRKKNLEKNQNLRWREERIRVEIGLKDIAKRGWVEKKEL
jgi:hypothetical protein